MSVPAAAFCKSCDYPLAGVPAAVCPECGRAFDPADPSTYDARPRARRRTWIRRGAWAIGVIVLVELLAPSRVAKLTWSWPNSDGVTATSKTKWCLVAPRWLPIRYPRWTSARWTKPIEPRGLVVSERSFWRVGLFSVQPDGGAISHVPAQSMGLVYGSLGTKNAAGVWNMYEMMPQNLDKLCDLLLYPDPDVVQLDYSVRVISPQTGGNNGAPPDGK
jgi:hypothetical protein